MRGRHAGAGPDRRPRLSPRRRVPLVVAACLAVVMSLLVSTPARAEVTDHGVLPIGTATSLDLGAVGDEHLYQVSLPASTRLLVQPAFFVPLGTASVTVTDQADGAVVQSGYLGQDPALPSRGWVSPCRPPPSTGPCEWP